MLSLKLTLGGILALCLLGLTVGQQLTYDERCQVTEGNGYRVDQCDSKKLLSCRDGRCQCSDPANQIYTYRNEPINSSSSRSKRSPGKKGGGFKKIAAGAVGGVVAYEAAKSAGKAINRGFTTTEKPPKYNKVFACYSRVGGQCALTFGNVEAIETTQGTTTSTTTTVAPTTTGNETSTTENSTSTDNSTTTTPAPTTGAPVAAALTALDLTKIPRCVQYAVCKSNTGGGNGTSGFLQKVDHDPRIGVCECDEGYKRTSKDLCVKINSGAGSTAGAATSLVILASLILNKIFV